MIIRDNAIRKLYPQTFTINAEVDAHDINGNKIDLDESLIALEIEKIKAEIELLKYKTNRAAEYPPFTDYLDGVVKGDQTQIDKYIADCQAVKAKYPK